MRSLILEKVALVVVPATLLLALALLLRGHDEPGGGFPAGLVATLALVLAGLAFGARRAGRVARALGRPLLAAGLAVCLAAGCLPLVAGRPFFTNLHLESRLPGIPAAALSTALLFDAGVFLVVVGSTCAALAAFLEAGR